jgi:hypothetical protein
MGTDGETSGEKKAKQVFWIVAAATLITLVGYNIYSGRTIEEIGLGGVGSVKFGKAGGQSPATPAAPSGSVVPDSPASAILQQGGMKDVSQEDMAKRQSELEAKLRHMEEDLKQAHATQARETPKENASFNRPPPPSAINLSGTWHDRSGASWIIQQRGGSLTVQEINPGFGVTAVGEGTVNGNQVQITYLSAMQTTGQVALTIGPEGHTMTGTAHDLTTGASFPLAFSR